MASQKNSNSLYPEVIDTNPEANSPFLSNTQSKPFSASSPSLYPSLDMLDPTENLFPDTENDTVPRDANQESTSDASVLESCEEVLVTIPGAIVHLIDKQQSVELAWGALSIVRLRQGDNVVAVLARVGDDIQWPLAKDEAVVKLDDSHYFFTLHVPEEPDGDSDGESKIEKVGAHNESDYLLNYGLTVASKGQEGLLKELDEILEYYSAFTVQKVAEDLEGTIVAREVSAEDMEMTGKEKELMEGSSVAYWTTLAPNVEDYSGRVAKLIAEGSGQLIRGILWCGDVTVDRLRWGDDFFKKRLAKGPHSEISPKALRRMKRVKAVTKMSEKVTTGILSGVVRISGFISGSIANSKAGQKFFSLLPGEIVLASLDGFNKICDAVEVAGRSVMSTTSVVTTGLVSQRYGEQAGEVTNEGLDAAGHALGTAWTVFKIRKALNPKGVIKPSTLVKAAAKGIAK